MDDVVKQLRHEAKMMRGMGMAGPNGSRARLCENAADKIEHLEALLSGRDTFIVNRDLWQVFTDQLPHNKRA